MKKDTKILLCLFIIIIFGAASGCIQATPKKIVPPAGFYKSFDKAKIWQQKTSLVTTAGNKNINSISVSVIRIDPQDNNAVYIGTESNGLFYSFNGGEFWQQPHQLTTGKINDIAVDPKNKCIVYTAFSNQVYKTTDCNRSWSQIYIDPRPKIIITSIAINSNNPKIVYITTDFGEVIKSVEGGILWTTIQRFNKPITKLIINPHAPSILYSLVSNTGIYKSTDNGDTWRSISLDIKKYPNSLVNSQLFFNTFLQDSLILTSKYGILKSDDGGETWKNLNLITQPSGTDILSFAINPQNEKEMYYGTIATVYYTKDGGVSWSVNKLPTGAQSSYLLGDPTNQSIVYLGMKNIITK